MFLLMALLASSAFAYVRYIYPDGNFCDVPAGYEDQMPPESVVYVNWGYAAYGYPIWPVWFSYGWWGGGYWHDRGYARGGYRGGYGYHGGYGGYGHAVGAGFHGSAVHGGAVRGGGVRR